MPKARIWGNWSPENEKGNIAVFCPGCNTNHIIATTVPQANKALWSFNGNMDSPTFSPSILIKTGSYAVPGFIDPVGFPGVICHSFITDGKIQFLNDCTHALKGQTVDLPEIND